MTKMNLWTLEIKCCHGNEHDTVMEINIRSFGDERWWLKLIRCAVWAPQYTAVMRWICVAWVLTSTVWRIRNISLYFNFSITTYFAMTENRTFFFFGFIYLADFVTVCTETWEKKYSSQTLFTELSVKTGWFFIYLFFLNDFCICLYAKFSFRASEWLFSIHSSCSTLGHCHLKSFKWVWSPAEIMKHWWNALERDDFYSLTLNLPS